MTASLSRFMLCSAPIALLLGGCVPSTGEPQSAAATTKPVIQGASLAEFFENYDQASLSLSPETKAYRGVRDDDYGKWDSVADEAAVARETLMQATAGAMRQSFTAANLSADDQLSVELFDATARRSATLFQFRNHGYIFDQMNGAHAGLPAFLINIHRASTVKEAQDYIARIKALGPQIDALSAKSAERFADGISPPRWVFAYVISDIDNLLQSSSAAGTSANPILADFAEKIAKLTISDQAKQQLVADATAAWVGQANPAYARLNVEMKRQQTLAPTADGIWRLPDGAAYYRALLGNYTTTDMTPTEIHELGLSEVTRIHGEMRGIMTKVGFKGNLQQFFAHLRDSPQYFHKTREAYLAEVDTRIKAVEAALPRYFGVLPKAPLQVKAVEAFREKSAGKAFYDAPAPDGSRPGIYYANLYRLRDMSITELEALAYHEGVPGHHLQLSIQTELKNIPPFRRYAGFTAYVEGWGLYSEELGKDMGFYTDPYSDFGRLGMELWRACRLVTDTGIHDKRWSRETAIQYLKDNTPNPDGDIEKAIERYIVYPGQATAYTIGKLKIMELRRKAQAKLGDRFDYRTFHDAVLTGGPMPLDVLDRRVTAWINAQP